MQYYLNVDQSLFQLQTFPRLCTGLIQSVQRNYQRAGVPIIGQVDSEPHVVSFLFKIRLTNAVRRTKSKNHERWCLNRVTRGRIE